MKGLFQLTFIMLQKTYYNKYNFEGKKTKLTLITSLTLCISNINSI